MKHLLLALALLFTVAAPAADVTITSVTPSSSAAGINRTHIAGEALSVGNLVYRKASDLKIYKADANSATAEVRVVYGIVVSAAASGAPCVVVTEDPALTLGATLTKGTAYVLSATAGGLAPLADMTTGDYVHVIAIGATTSTIAFNAKGPRITTAL